MIAIFQLPIIVSEEILLNMTQVQLWQLSLCSKKAEQVVKNIINRKYDFLTLAINLDERFSFSIYDERGEEVERNEFLIADMREAEDAPAELSDSVYQGIAYKEFSVAHAVKTFWEDQMEAMKTFLRRLMDFYHRPFKYLDIHCGLFCIQEMLEFFKSIQVGELEYIDVTSDHDRDVSRVLNRLPKTENIKFDFQADQEFLDNDMRVYEFNSMHVVNGNWFTLPRLLTCNCQELILFGTPLTSETLNLFLKVFIQGASPKLRLLDMRVRHLDYDVLFDGIPHEIEVEDGNVRKVRIERLNGEEATVAAALMVAGGEEPWRLKLSLDNH